VSALDDWFAKNMPDVEEWAARHGTRSVEGWTWDRQAGPNQLDALLIPRKVTGYIEVSDELLMDCGAIPDTRPKPPPLPWRWRLRNRISDLRERAARRAYKIIAGEWPHDREDDW
jgi:hypothetical protein